MLHNICLPLQCRLSATRSHTLSMPSARLSLRLMSSMPSSGPGALSTGSALNYVSQISLYCSLCNSTLEFCPCTSCCTNLSLSMILRRFRLFRHRGKLRSGRDRTRIGTQHQLASAAACRSFRSESPQCRCQVCCALLRTCLLLPGTELFCWNLHDMTQSSRVDVEPACCQLTQRHKLELVKIAALTRRSLQASVI